MRIFMLVYIQLYPGASADTALIAIETDWKNDIIASHAMDSVAAANHHRQHASSLQAPAGITGASDTIARAATSELNDASSMKDGLSRSGLHRSLCQLADHWTVNVDLDDCVSFLSDMLSRITQARAPGSPLLKWRSLPKGHVLAVYLISFMSLTLSL